MISSYFTTRQKEGTLWVPYNDQPEALIHCEAPQLVIYLMFKRKFIQLLPFHIISLIGQHIFLDCNARKHSFIILKMHCMIKLIGPMGNDGGFGNQLDQGQENTNNALTAGISILVVILACMFIAFYKRKSL